MPERVEDWRGGDRLPVALAGPFEHRASVRPAIAPFPVSFLKTQLRHHGAVLVYPWCRPPT